ncbi:unnamed protein product [Trichogramma brassicae]|uniref:Uncharacterized protein n=1 Tax=Trichogramma brassicae TaxID=86971 RepID=A0A6H5IID7_9HYME|nr:unnamed protein product [Trichogramma brassicae]
MDGVPLRTITDQLRELKGSVNLIEPRARCAFFAIFNELIRSWNGGPLPNLLDVYNADEIEAILKLAVEDPVAPEAHRLEFVELVAAIGYRDGSRRAGPPVRYRVTPLHRLFYSQACSEFDRMARALFRIYDRFTVNCVDASPEDPEAINVSHLHVACCVGDGLDIVERCLASGHDPNVFTKSGVTPLYLALTLGNRALIELLLRRGALPSLEVCGGFRVSALHHICCFCRDDLGTARFFFDVCHEIGRPLEINAGDSVGDTPLHVALTYGCSVGLLRLLLEHGADPNAANLEGTRPLHVVCERQYPYEFLESLCNLVRDTGRPVYMDVRDSRGWTPLHSALRAGNIKAAEFLLENRADATWADNQGWTPRSLIYEFDLNYMDERGFTHFQAACSVPNGRELVVKFLQHGQNPNFFVNGYSLLRTALHNDTEWAAELLRRGADPTYVDADGSTALHTICRDGRVYLLNLVQVAVQINVPDKKGDSPLHLALESGNKEATEILLTKGADPNLVNAKGSTPLHIMCQKSEGYKLVEIFFKIVNDIGKPVQVNVRDSFGNTPLHLTIRHTSMKKSEILLVNGANPNLADKDGCTALHLICNTRRHDAMRRFFEIIDKNPQTVQIDAQNKNGDTPLHMAVRTGNNKKFEMLLNRGADPNVTNQDRWTALHFLSRRISDDFMLHFFEITDKIRRTVQIDAQNKDGDTPLLMALQSRGTKKFEMLLERGADPNVINRDGWTALHFLSRRISDDFMLHFFEITDNIRKTVQIDAQNKDGDTPLHMAVRSGSNKKFEMLLERGADPNVTNRDGWTALHFLSRRISDDFMWHFFEITDKIRRTVMIDARDKKGRTPLCAALFVKNTEAAEQLLERGANPNLADVNGWTPLHIMCIECNWFLKTFFRINEERQQPVDINAKTNEGRTPLNLLRNRMPVNYEEASRYLEQRGAELD